ncbi:MAG: hypothetical protein HUU22_02115 [Phycisphaerae bacterium]|nr:hypothetical protein [Phycisphaerae bacterium]NUQ44810.1 hypothetical protein [Phycisphaerae bacterium]
MQPSEPNDHGVLEPGHREFVATRGRAFAAVTIALCEDGLYRSGAELHYALGGFGFPITTHSPGYATLDAARMAGIECLLRAWHTPFPSDPDSVRAELSDMRSQIEDRLRQPSLL